jgi:glycosyltransferase involved in cell wall biosynthesis
MRILYVAPMNSIHSRRWIKYFVEQGHDVHIVNVGFAANSRLANVTYHFEQLDHNQYPVYVDLFKRFLPFRRRLKRVIREVSPDLIHVHGVDAYAYIVHHCGFHPLVATAWGVEIMLEPKQSLKYKFIVKSVLKTADAITCDAVHIRDEIVRLGAEATKVHIMYFGTDMREWNPSKRDQGVKAELGFPGDAKVVISLRQLKPIYDIPTFLRSIPLVLAEMPKARFIVASDGPDRQALVALAEELGVSTAVRFVGFLSDEDLQRYTASADIYVSSSPNDAGLAASTAEAMASQVPAIITDYGNNKDWVVDGESGMLFTIGDYHQLAEKIVFVLRNPETAAQFAARGREIINTRNNWNQAMEKVDALYRQVVPGR